MAREKTKTTYVNDRYFIDYTSGEVIREEHIQQIRKGVEPAFVKLYLEHIMAFSDIPKNTCPILLEILKHTTYADKKDPDGGQIVYLNSALRDDISKIVKKSRSTIDHSIAHFVKADFMKKIVEGKYQLNPHLFGKGEFKDISNIRATYDYKAKAVKAEIIENDTDKQENWNAEISNIQ
jgi:hypothetical protein